jgi:hypothetical protein
LKAVEPHRTFALWEEPQQRKIEFFLRFSCNVAAGVHQQLRFAFCNRNSGLQVVGQVAEGDPWNLKSRHFIYLVPFGAWERPSISLVA